MANVEIFGRWPNVKQIGRGLKRAALTVAPRKAVQYMERRLPSYQGSVDYFGVWYNPFTWFSSKQKTVAVVAVPAQAPTPARAQKASEHRQAASLIDQGLPVDKAEATAKTVLGIKTGLDFKNPKTLALAAGAGIALYLFTKKRR